MVRSMVDPALSDMPPGTLGENVSAMVNLFLNGRSFNSTKESEAVARMTVAFGRVSM